jgi:mannose-6-phosphate isomerase-like protein (cupin superfamily)
MESIKCVNLRDACASLDAAWVPKIAGELNGQYVKVAKFEGEYVWHSHANEDEMFLVIEGRVDIHLCDKTIGLDAGEFTIVPRGVEHKPVAASVAHVMLFEPASTRSTGDVDDQLTIEPGDLERT